MSAPRRHGPAWRRSVAVTVRRYSRTTLARQGAHNPARPHSRAAPTELPAPAPSSVRPCAGRNDGLNGRSWSINLQCTVNEQRAAGDDFFTRLQAAGDFDQIVVAASDLNRSHHQVAMLVSH